MARPTLYNEALAAAICAKLSQGKSLRSVCKDPKMPGASTVFLWLSQDEKFLEQYTRAKAESADAMSEDMLDIADDSEEDVQRSRLRVETRKWLASKLKPKKYGDKLGLTGEDGGPLQVQIVRYADDPPAE